ncbi:hypothetical protein CHX26_01115 [Porphyrobacter sp. HT-58-2]|nr:hypothetical protein CHX26_01115 [Porphyrobacter sp. HT-58-2]
MAASSSLAAQEVAEVDAFASLEPAANSLTLVSLNDMRLGRVTIPNSARLDEDSPNPFCIYLIEVNETPQRFSRSVLEAPQFTGSPFPGASPSGCQFVDNDQSPALLRIGCLFTFEMSYFAEWSGGGRISGTFFDEPPIGKVGLYADGETSLLNRRDFRNGSVTCPDTGFIDVLLGGQFEVRRNAAAGENLNVGTIRFGVNY